PPAPTPTLSLTASSEDVFALLCLSQNSSILSQHSSTSTSSHSSSVGHLNDTGAAPMTIGSPARVWRYSSKNVNTWVITSDQLPARAASAAARSAFKALPKSPAPTAAFFVVFFAI